MLGLEAESVHKISGEFEGIVIAQILTKDKVPGSDKLLVARSVGLLNSIFLVLTIYDLIGRMDFAAFFRFQAW
jgi:hypothetical protein